MKCPRRPGHVRQGEGVDVYNSFRHAFAGHASRLRLGGPCMCALDTEERSSVRATANDVTQECDRG